MTNLYLRPTSLAGVACRSRVPYPQRCHRKRLPFIPWRAGLDSPCRKRGGRGTRETASEKLST